MILNNSQIWQSFLPKLDPAANKYTRGHVVILGGEYTGAARLAASAAARMGAGLVTLLCRQSLWPIYAAACEAHILVQKYGSLSEVIAVMRDRKAHGFVIGPGFRPSGELQKIVLAALATRKPCVLDAGALTVFAGNPKKLFQHLHGDVVLTPHEGEFEKLFGLLETRFAGIEYAVQKIPAVVVLKGQDTLIAQIGKPTILNNNAPPTLATAGTGDVLAGMIGALLVKGMRVQEAAAAAVWLHGEAAVRCGPALVASDLMKALLENNLGSE